VSKAIVLASQSGPDKRTLAPKTVHLRRFIQAYRNMLNELQMWSVRATFDVTWN